MARDDDGILGKGQGPDAPACRRQEGTCRVQQARRPIRDPIREISPPLGRGPHAMRARSTRSSVKFSHHTRCASRSTDHFDLRPYSAPRLLPEIACFHWTYAFVLLPSLKPSVGTCAASCGGLQYKGQKASSAHLRDARLEPKCRRIRISR